MKYQRARRGFGIKSGQNRRREPRTEVPTAAPPFSDGSLDGNAQEIVSSNPYVYPDTRPAAIRIHSAGSPVLVDASKLAYGLNLSIALMTLWTFAMSRPTFAQTGRPQATSESHIPDDSRPILWT